MAMRVPALDFANLSPKQAMEEQLRLASRVLLCAPSSPTSSVCGIDVHVRESTAEAAAVLLSYPGLSVIAHHSAERPTTLPYIPGLLAYREMPAVFDALRGLEGTPNVILCDGHGLAHPRRAGMATHIGIMLDMPTIGCAKSLLIGTHEAVPLERGAWRPLVDRGEVIGAAVRTRRGVRPVYVSPGHRMDLDTAILIVLACAPKYRIPEPLRLAHTLATVGEKGFAHASARRRVA
jgi:deoxyribonuclease V